MDKDFLEKEATSNPLGRYLHEAETKNPASSERGLPGEPDGFLPFFYIELLDRFKSTLNSIKTFTHLSREKLNDAKLREYFYRVMDEDIEEIESVIHSLLRYIEINSPVVKSNTVHLILDEILKKNEDQINTRKIKIVRKYDKELPETIVHETQLSYLLNCILEYAVALTVPNGSIGFLTKVTDGPKEGEEDRGLPQEGRFVEIVIVFTGYRKGGERTGAAMGPSALKEEKMDLKLLLVKEIVRKNHGLMKFDVNEKKPRTQISLIFPIERRRLVSYPSPTP